MPPRHQFYNPIVQQGDQVAEVEMPPIRGLPVSVVGMYLLTADVSMWLRRLAETHHDDDSRQALYEAADLIDGSGLEPEGPDEPEQCPEKYEGIERCQLALGHDGPHYHTSSADGRTVTWPGVPATAPPSAPPASLPSVAPPPGVARIEMFPNEDASYWYARVVDDGGNIVTAQGVVEGVNSTLVEQQATARWPGVPVYAIPDALGDSIWDEQVTIFGFNGRRRPSPRRLWPTPNY